MMDELVQVRIHPDVLARLPDLAPGVVGTLREEYNQTTFRTELWLPLVVARHEGSGDVGRFLDTLPRAIKVVVPTVVNPRLAGMLARRDFLPGTVADPETDEPIDAWVRPAS